MAWRFHFPIRKYDFNICGKIITRQQKGPWNPSIILLSLIRSAFMLALNAH